MCSVGVLRCMGRVSVTANHTALYRSCTLRTFMHVLLS